MLVLRAHQLPALAGAGFRAIAPDMRGDNLTDKPLSGYNIETLVEDVVALTQAIAGPQARPHIVGPRLGRHRRRSGRTP